MSCDSATNKDLNANTSHKQSLQTFEFPEVWQDDDIMGELLAPFRLRELDSQGYDSKMSFWQDLIAKYCTHKGAPTFSKRELQLAFARKHYLPFGLDTVLTEMQRTKKIRLRSEYVYDPLNTWSGWAVQSLVRKPLFWGIHRIKSSLIGIDANSPAFVEYVHLEVIKKFCKDLLLCALPDFQGKLMHFDELKKHLAVCVSAPQVTDQCLLLCLRTLHAQCKIGLEYKEEDGEQQIHLIKFPSKNDPNTHITQADRDIHNLKITQERIAQQLEDIAEEIKVNDDKARRYLKEGKRQLAKTYLRKKHLLEQNHEKRSNALHNIDTLLNNVNDAQYNGEIIDAYKIGAKALQNALNDSGLSYNNIDEVVASVADGIEMQQDVQQSLANVNLADTTTGECEDDLERELEAILGEGAEVTQKSTGEDKQNNKQQPKSKHTIYVATPANTTITTTASSSVPTTPKKMNNISIVQQPAGFYEVSDSELLAMLEGLEVEDEALPNENTIEPRVS